MEKNQKHKQQDMTELNSDGDRGKEGEDLNNIELTNEEEEQLKKKLEELRKRDPFIYR